MHLSSSLMSANLGLRALPAPDVLIKQRTQACLHPEFRDPTKGPFRRVGEAPAFEQANRLVKSAHRELALSVAKDLRREPDCAKARHDFLFLFLPKDGSVKDLPYDLERIYSTLCRARD